MHPDCSTKIWNSYVIPRLTYGLEVMYVTQKQFDELENYQRLALRYIQHLPPGTAKEAVLLLLGVRPVQAIVERNTLVFFGNICRLDGSKEREVVIRQACMTDRSSQSFAQRVKALLSKYQLPSIYTLISQIPNKKQWKWMVKKAIDDYWLDAMCGEAKRKKSLKYQDVTICSLGKSHPTWNLAPMSHRNVLKTGLKVKLMTNQLQLQAVLSTEVWW